MDSLTEAGLEEVLTVDVVLTGREIREEEDARLVHLPFAGRAVGPLFTGQIQPGAADDQIHRDGRMVDATADYMIRGEDPEGKTASVHVVNRYREGRWKPTVTTDSAALDFLNGADCAAVLEHRPQGPIVHIFTKR